jgi:hypothetical protein
MALKELETENWKPKALDPTLEEEEEKKKEEVQGENKTKAATEWH